MARQVVDVRKGARLHAVDVKAAVEMIDLMLQNPREPAGSLDSMRLSLFIQILDSHALGALDQRAEARDTEAAFKELDSVFGVRNDLGVYQHHVGNRLALVFSEALRRDPRSVFGTVF